MLHAKQGPRTPDTQAEGYLEQAQASQAQKQVQKQAMAVSFGAMAGVLSFLNECKSCRETKPIEDFMDSDKPNTCDDCLVRLRQDHRL
jgi:hypothetical protein